MVYGELKHFVWYMVNFEETQWYIMKYPFILRPTFIGGHHIFLILKILNIAHESTILTRWSPIILNVKNTQYCI